MFMDMSTPFIPENILEGPDGRWYHDDLDVTDHAFDWWCAQEHTWSATLGARTALSDAGCPTCYLSDHPLDNAESAHVSIDVPALASALRTVCQSLPTDNLLRHDRVALAKVVYVELLGLLSNLEVVVALTSSDDNEAMTVLHDQFAVGLTSR